MKKMIMCAAFMVAMASFTVVNAQNSNAKKAAKIEQCNKKCGKECDKFCDNATCKAEGCQAGNCIKDKSACQKDAKACCKGKPANKKKGS
ncbi:hypothetical protein [Parabacteroides provencensis]|uniref:hypothetical protein n=1 Tax=Parabacteroides provencensis TaxID=1944636 RepID=UPI000C155ECF|nr:hypothetical protein [Parabacteroides provencensis]